MIISTTSIGLNASKKEILKYVKQLSTGKKKYVFDSHEGFTFTNGSIEKEGSLFWTREKFLGIKIKLNFMLTRYTKNKIEFRLIKPFNNFGIYGYFGIKKNKLTLEIFTKAKGFKKTLIKIFLPIYRPIIKKQITKEVKFIKKEIEK